ncbi:MAG: AAA family ATPase [Alphaproteobacteria bacterium]|nr:AAA family ATPase [Alphaproteobacteria bacterium]MBQ8678098.1 AAA family ATPase [Alphaproteobacteria bacterium]
MTDKTAHTIVISNEKGGTGKSTISLHLAIKLLQEGFKVATIDLDGRQGTLSRYLNNRKLFCLKNNIKLPMPEHFKFAPTEDYSHIAEHSACVEMQIKSLLPLYDAIVIDTPGNKNYLFELGHKFADTLITPIGDSLIDLNSISEINFETGKIGRPGVYANYIWDVKKQLAARGKNYLNWIVVGNKISSTKSKNKNIVFEYLNQLSKLYGFRVNDGFKDRVIYKELFLEGLTVLDMNQDSLKRRMTLSHIAAKQEIKALAEFICPE